MIDSNYMNIGKPTTIVAGFPGVGKTHYYRKNAGTPGMVVDPDSSLFHWHLEKGLRIGKSAFWPENYVKYISACVGVFDTVLVSTHTEVRDALLLPGVRLLHYLVYPSRDQKDDYLDRCWKRGSPESLIEIVNDSWNTWLDELESENRPIHIKLKPGQFFSDVMTDILRK